MVAEVRQEKNRHCCLYNKKEAHVYERTYLVWDFPVLARLRPRFVDKRTHSRRRLPKESMKIKEP